MPIPVACPGCSARLNAPDAAAGKRVKCPKCQALIPVPDTTPAFEEVEDEVPARTPSRRPRNEEQDDDRPRRPRDDRDDDRSRKRRKQPARSGGVPVWAWVVGGLVVAGAAAAGVAVSLGKKKDDAPVADAGGGGGLLGQLGAAGGEPKDLKPGEKKETRGGRQSVLPGPDGWAAVDDPTHGLKVLLPGHATPDLEFATNNPKLVAERGHNYAAWAANIDKAHVGEDAKHSGRVTVAAYRRTAADPYPTDPKALLEVVRKVQWNAFDINREEANLTATPVAVDGRPGIEVRHRKETRKERLARTDPAFAAGEPDDPDESVRHTVLRAAADGRWLYVVHFDFPFGPPNEAAVKRVFESVKLNPPAGG